MLPFLLSCTYSTFDKGLFGEIAQVGYALFIGLAFGATLYLTKRIYPLILVHAFIDFFSKIEAVGSVEPTVGQQTAQGSITINCAALSLFILCILSFYKN